jgi:hypothetical protein
MNLDQLGDSPLTSDEVICGTKSIDTNAAAITASQACVEVLCQADPDNLVDVLIGSATSQPIKLKPGQNINVPAKNVNKVYAKSSAGTAVLNWIARY